MTPISTIKATGKTTLYAFPGGVALSTWSTNRRLFTETATGYYTTTVDETIGSGVWYLFEGASQPASYNNGLNEIFDFIQLKIQAKTNLIPASPTAVSDIPTTSAIATAVASIQILSRLDSMVESNGGGQFRFDTISLSLAPAGGGGTVNITVEDSSITIG